MQKELKTPDAEKLCKSKDDYLLSFLIAITIIAVLFLFLILVPISYGNFLLDYYKNDSTVAGAIGTIASNLLIALITTIYVVLTGVSVIQSKNVIAQTKKEHDIIYIQTRLEKLYYPLKMILDIYQIGEKEPLSKERIPILKSKLNKIMPYSYLASDDLSPSLNKFTNIIYRNGVLIEDLANKALNEQIQNTDQPEKVVETAKFYQFMGKTLSSSEWEALLGKEIMEAAPLYLIILNVINTDIEFYKKRLSELND